MVDIAAGEEQDASTTKKKNWSLRNWGDSGALKGARLALGIYRPNSGARLRGTPPRHHTGRNASRGNLMVGKAKGTKAEFPPLLSDGLHKMDLASLKALVVGGFPKSARREPLWNNFLAIIDKLVALKLPCEIWVDGSFLTEKIEPDDVDFIVDIELSLVLKADPAQYSFLERLAKQDFCQSHKLHSFILYKVPAIDKNFSKYEAIRDYWKRTFGRSLVKKEPKGIAVVEVKP
jgi:hypothetical protein